MLLYDYCFQRAIKDYEAELASLKKALDEVADKDPVVMWSRIAEMADDATKFEILAKVSFYQFLLVTRNNTLSITFVYMFYQK